VDSCKRGLPAAQLGAPRLQQMPIPACPAGKWRKLPQNRMADKLQEIAGVGIPVRITNPRARFVKTLSRLARTGGSHAGKIERLCCVRLSKRLTLRCGFL
jgi:hypothetical protein